ncbi:MAG: VC_2705 family sodium/solute symporter, partial [Elainellaceae cyanobacterium]
MEKFLPNWSLTEAWTAFFIGVSLFLYLTIGWHSRVKSAKVFIVEGQNIPAIANGVATAGDWISAASFLSLTGVVSFLGYDGAIYILGWTGGYVLIALLIAPYLRKFGQYTIPDFVAARYYSNTARLVSVFACIFICLVYITGQIRGVGIIFSRFLQVDVNTGVLLSIILVGFFAILGGMRGITWTQIAQYSVFCVAFMVPAIAIAHSLTGVPIPQIAFTTSDIIESLNQVHTDLGFAEYTQPFVHRSPLDMCLVALTLMTGTAGLPHIIVRFYTVKNMRAARFSAGWALVFIAIIYTTAPVMAGFARYCFINALHDKPVAVVEQIDWVRKWEKTGLFVIADRNNDGVISFAADPAANEVNIDADTVVLSMPEIAALSPWVTGLVAAGGLAAALSTAAGLLLVISSSIAHDVYYRMVNIEASESQRVVVGRLMIGFALAISGCLGLHPPGFVAQVVAFAFGLAASSFFPAIVLGVFDKRVNKEGAIAGMLLGIVFTAGYIIGVEFYQMPRWCFGISPEGIGAVGLLLNGLVSIGVSRLTPPPPSRIQAWVDDLRIPGDEPPRRIDIYYSLEEKLALQNAQLNELNRQLEIQIRERQQAEQQLQNLIRATAATTGQAFFPALVRHTAEAMGVAYALVTEKTGDKLHTLAFWANGALQPNVTYDIAQTPCDVAIREGQFYCASQLYQRLPPGSDFAGAAVEAYLGVAMQNRQGEVIGSLCILDQKPVPDPERAEQVLRILAARAAAELERKRTSTALENLNRTLEATVESRTAELQEREARYRALVEVIPDLMLRMTSDGTYLDIVLGKGIKLCNSKNTVVGQTIFQSMPTEHAHKRMDYIRRALETQQTQYYTYDILVDGDRRFEEARIVAISQDEVLVIVRDITEAAQAEEALRASELRWQFALEGAGDGVWDWNPQTNAVFFSPQWKKMLGYAAEERINRLDEWESHIYPEDSDRHQIALECHLAGQTPTYQSEYRMRGKDGQCRWFLARGKVIEWTPDGDPLRVIGTHTDISPLKQVQEQIIYNALHDPLTNLPNRKLLTEQIELTLEQARRSKTYEYAVLFIDLNRFKLVNDSLGHAVGDQLLVAIAQRLTARLRETDLVARLGGDEFVILLKAVSHLDQVIQIVEGILADSQTPLLINNREIVISLSIGVVLGLPSYHQASDVVRDADIAMYQAKAQGLNLYKFFDAAMRAQIMHQLTVETDLRRALEQDELILYYQPIFSLNNQRLMGFETLVRWQHLTHGLLSPDEFIPIAEETGIIRALDSWVFRSTCNQIADWTRRFAAAKQVKFSINLSVQD